MRLIIENESSFDLPVDLLRLAADGAARLETQIGRVVFGVYEPVGRD